MTGKTVTIDQDELRRLRTALHSVTKDLRDLMDNGFPKPPRKNCNADVASMHSIWWEDRWEGLERADAVLADTEHLV